MSKIHTVNCPTCHTEVRWSETSHFRPFCSDRCRLIDFGEWAKEEKIIAGNPLPLSESNDEGSPL